MNKPEIMRLNAEKQQPKISKTEAAKRIAKQRERDAELVTGIFRNLENPAQNGSRGVLSFGYKAYPGDDYVFYELADNERYTIPRGVARHLNNNCFYREYQHLDGEFGSEGLRGAAPDGKLCTKNMQASRKVHRCQFNNLDFMGDDVEMRPADLIEVTTVP